MIPKDLLLASGTVDALVTLSKEGPQTTGELTGPMDLSDSTVRTRMRELESSGLVNVEAEMRGEQPVKVFALSDDGRKVASSIRTLIGETPPVPDDVEPAESAEDADTADPEPAETAESDSGEEPDAGDVKPPGVTFAGDGEAR